MAKGLNTMEHLRQPFEQQAVESATFAAVAELMRACGKHPTFPDRMTIQTAGSVADHLRIVRMVNDTRADCKSAVTIFEEEFLEMQEAVMHGDLDAARTELVQSMAMLMRIYVHLPEYCTLLPSQEGGAA